MGMQSIFSIIGPIMVGPSSSHTAGAVNIGLAAKKHLKAAIKEIEITLYGSYAAGVNGHKTDVALVGGCLGFEAKDVRVRDALVYAQKAGINIVVKSDVNPSYHTNTAVLIITDINGRIISVRGSSVGGGSIVIDEVLLLSDQGMEVEPIYTFTGHDNQEVEVLGFETCAELIAETEKRNCLISDIAVEQEALALGASIEEVRQQVSEILQVMRDSIAKGIRGNIKSIGGLTDDDACKLIAAIESKTTRFSDTYLKAAAWAMAVNEVNTEMGVVAACPTGGACGLVPGAVLAAAESLNATDAQIIDALLTAAAIGQRFSKAYTLCASVGGCQVEIGIATGMAAAAVCQLMGGSARQICDATAIALKSIIGMTCGALGGLCESPCIKRNGTCTSISLTAANMGLAGIKSQVPLDEVFWAIMNTGKHLPKRLLGTQPTGLAATATGMQAYMHIYGAEKMQIFREDSYKIDKETY